MGVSIAGNITARGALDTVNNHNTGHGMYNQGGTSGSGQRTQGQTGQYNNGTSVGQRNYGTSSAGQYNWGNSGLIGEATAAFALYFTGPTGARLESWSGPGLDIASENAGPALSVEHFGVLDGDAVSLVTNHGDGLQVVGTTTDINADITGNLSGSVGSVALNGITSVSLDATANSEIADAVWDEAMAGHAVAGTAGKALTDAGAASDPWTTPLPGAYVAGTAGHIIGNLLTTIPNAVWTWTTRTLTAWAHLVGGIRHW
jgi:hypothetical protein